MQSDRRTLALTVAAVAAASLLGCCTGAGGVLSWQRLAGGPGAAGESAPPARVTLKHFNEIKTGMSYGDVVRIVGFEGKEFARDQVRAGAPGFSQSYIWTNPDGSNLVCEFQQDFGRLHTKTQRDLR